MKLRDKVPEWAGASRDTLVSALPFSMLMDLIPAIADAYKHVLPMWYVLRSYGYQLGPNDDEVQLHCQLPSHGGQDQNKSARYFATDRDTGGAWGGVHCWKCQKRMTAFWYVYVREKHDQDAKYTDVFRIIEERYGVPFPRDVILDFDPDEFYSLSAEGAVKDDLSARFGQARAVRDALKLTDPSAYAQALISIYTARASAQGGQQP